MASLDSLRVRHFLAETKVTRVLDDGPVALRISYSGTSTTAPVISVITATSLTLTTSLGATVFTFSTYDTLLKLANAITAGVGDGSGSAAGYGFEARILDALPTTITTASNLIASAGLTSSIVNGETVYDVMLDSSTTKMLAYRVAYDRNVSINRKLNKGHRVKVNKFQYNANISAAEAGAIRIYEFSPSAGTTTLVWAATSVDSTGSAGSTELDFSDAPLTASEGNEYLVAVTDATSLTDNATNFLQVLFTRE